MTKRPSVPCELCGEPTHYTGTKRCDNCWEVERRLAKFVQSENGLLAVRRALRQVYGDCKKLERVWI